MSGYGPGPQIASASSLLHQATVTLTNDQIKALPTPANWVTVVESPSSNSILIFLCAVFRKSSGTDSAWAAQYANVSDDFPASLWSISYADDFELASQILSPNSFVTSTTSYGITQPVHHIVSITDVLYDTAIQTDYNNIIGQPLRLVAYNTAGNYTGGDATNRLHIAVSYYIFNTVTGEFE